MKIVNGIAALLLAITPLSVSACPMCSEAIIADGVGTGAEVETNNFPAAMNQSIYLMVSMPYIALGVVGFCIYRGVKKNDEFKEISATEETRIKHG